MDTHVGIDVRRGRCRERLQAIGFGIYNSGEDARAGQAERRADSSIYWLRCAGRSPPDAIVRAVVSCVMTAVSSAPPVASCCPSKVPQEMSRKLPSAPPDWRCGRQRYGWHSGGRSEDGAKAWWLPRISKGTEHPVLLREDRPRYDRAIRRVAGGRRVAAKADADVEMSRCADSASVYCTVGLSRVSAKASADAWSADYSRRDGPRSLRSAAIFARA